jgi:tetratricopeptide (TPR) repeat protein
VTTTRIATTLLFAAAVGCAGAPARRDGAPTAAASSAAAAKAAPGLPPDASEALSARAQRLFAEALQAQEDQRKLKVPTDWPLLERKWRAVLDAEEIAEARYNVGVTLEGQGKLSEAREEYQKALADKPGLRQAAVNLGVLLEKQGDRVGAQALYAGVVRDYPEDARARERLAVLYRGTGQTDEAWRLAREALLRDAKSVGAYKVLAGVSIQRGNLDIAQLILLRAQKLDPTDPEIPYLSGQVLEKQGDAAGAAAAYKKALGVREFLPARYALLQSAVKGQRWAAVAEHAQAVLKEEPKNAGVHLALGVAQRHLDKPDEALASLAKAEELAGDKLPETHLARGVLFMRSKNQCEPALEELRTFTRLAGPMASTDSPALKLQRECEQIITENKRALEAAKAMQADAERKAALRKTAAKVPADGDGVARGAAPTSTSNPAR